MKSWTKILTYLVAIETFLIIIYLCGKMKVDANSPGVFISSLGVLITFVVAWQIWQTMASREELRRVECVGRKYDKLANEIELLKDLPEAYFLYSLGHKEYERKSYKLSYQYFIQASEAFYDNNVPFERFTTVALSLMKDCLLNLDKSEKASLSDSISKIDKMIEKSRLLERFSEDAINKLTEIKHLIKN